MISDLSIIHRALTQLAGVLPAATSLLLASVSQNRASVGEGTSRIFLSVGNQLRTVGATDPQLSRGQRVRRRRSVLRVGRWRLAGG